MGSRRRHPLPLYGQRGVRRSSSAASCYTGLTSATCFIAAPRLQPWWVRKVTSLCLPFCRGSLACRQNQCLVSRCRDVLLSAWQCWLCRQRSHTATPSHSARPSCSPTAPILFSPVEVDGKTSWALTCLSSVLSLSVSGKFWYRAINLLFCTCSSLQYALFSSLCIYRNSQLWCFCT